MAQARPVTREPVLVRTAYASAVTALVAETDDSVVVLRALTGRGDLPEGFTAL
ncbi:hypothetical protein [Nocardioides sp.]|uniref:hypothetical protein n=1 Tax=Nocardioides sp. TaxID=35761 RepID=UPI002ED0ACFB